jgi:hypothetical protein
MRVAKIIILGLIIVIVAICDAILSSIGALKGRLQSRRSGRDKID